MKEKIEAAKELGLLSKKLATIMLDVPVIFNEHDFELNTPDIEKVKEIFQELEFRRLIDNFTKTFSTETEKISTETINKSLPLGEVSVGQSRKGQKRNISWCWTILFIWWRRFKFSRNVNYNTLRKKHI